MKIRFIRFALLFNLLSFIFLLSLLVPMASVDAYSIHNTAIISNAQILETQSFSIGTGSSDSPFIIEKSSDMNDLSANVAQGNSFSGKYFKVADGVKQITLGNFISIGNSTKPFAGIFNGNGVDFNLEISNSLDYQGVFGCLSGGTVENFSVSGNISAKSYVGGAVGNLVNGTVRNIYSTANIIASGSYAGGIVGYLDRGVVSNTYNMGEVVATSYAGGIVGANNGRYYYQDSRDYYNTVSYSYSAGKVSANSYVGGVIGGGEQRNNTRQYLYYDLSVTVKYMQPKTLKPTQTVVSLADSATVKGLDSGKLLNAGNVSIGFTSEVWTFKKQEN